MAATSRLQRRARAGASVVIAVVSRVSTKRVRRRGVLLSALLVPMFVALGILPASANNGTVTVSQNCRTWHASVVLHHNVTHDRTVDVVTTIPGTKGITGGHYNTSFGQVWSASGPAPASGTVTLKIYLPNKHLEFTETKALQAPTGCGTTTSTTRVSTTTMASTTTTTVATEGSTVTTSPSTATTSTMPDTSTVNASGNVVTTSTIAPTAVTTAGGAAAATAAHALPLTGGGGPGPAIGVASLLGGAVMLLISRRRRGRAT
jgi:hypothetical protein